MERLLPGIVSYLEYLNGELGLCVSMHGTRESLHQLPHRALEAVLPYNSHVNPYCILVKRDCHGRCMEYQRALIAKEGGKAEICVCHAGVRELIYPIQREGVRIGFVAVSGYRSPIPPAETDPRKAVWEAALREEEPPVTLCDAVIPPLCLMMEQLFSCKEEKSRDEYTMILQFLQEYHSSVTLAEVCRRFHRSASYISHTFKRRSGMSFRAYCNALKLEDAKRLLEKTELSVTRIAMEVGFCDASYFIGLFRQRFGISPLKYRKKEKSEPHI
ncbi:MAG: helix-turn-helix domain-containing protein [Clostridia bacterium]|nr:helix-turn-helix domain-containing protein [Clostridia bacterium]